MKRDSEEYRKILSDAGKKGGGVTGKRMKEEAIARWKAEDKRCPYCNEPISYEKRRTVFCNHSHAASYSNPTAKLKDGIYITLKEDKECLICGKPVKTNAADFCSSVCNWQKKYEDYIERWLAGEETGTTNGGNMNTFVRRWIFETRESKCEECGWGETNVYSHTIPLEVEHVDGNPKNNRPENLKLLCPNCHSLTSTYRGVNGGNVGRKELQKRRVRK